MGDPFGKAVKDFWEQKEVKSLIVHSDICDDDEIPVPLLFRSFDEMPDVEQRALELSTGKVLDVGACAGTHALWLQNKGVDVTALDISYLCCEVMKVRGVKKVIYADIYEYGGEKYDTILLLMNGIGIAGIIEQLEFFIGSLKQLLNPGGRILFDSSDIKYLFEDMDDDDEPFDENEEPYYGEVLYQMEYDEEVGEGFPWLFVSPEKIKPFFEAEGFEFKVLLEGDNSHYLASAQLK